MTSPENNRPHIMFLVPADYDALERKGVLHMIHERSEGGVFRRVVTVHPLAKYTRCIRLDDVHVVYEFGLNGLPLAARWPVLKRLLAPVYLVWLLARLQELIKSESIHLIRATDPYFMGVVGWILSYKYGVPFCVSIHADYDKRYELDGAKGAPTILGSRRLAKRVERFVLSRAPMVMPIRESLAEYAVKSGARPETIRVIPHGIDLEPFRRLLPEDARESLGLPENVRLLSFVGRLSKENYVDDMLAMVKSLAETRDDFVLVMAGGGNEEQRLREEVANDPVMQKHVRLLGFLPRERAILLRRISDVSLCLMGGFSLIEACAAGRPVISYDVEWHHELVRDGETGFLLPEHDIDALVKAVNRLLDQPRLARKMGEQARTLAFDRHEAGKASAVKVRCYQELLEMHADKG